MVIILPTLSKYHDCSLADRIDMVSTNNLKGRIECMVSSEEGVIKCMVSTEEGVIKCIVSTEEGVIKCIVSTKEGINKCTVSKRRERECNKKSMCIWILK